MHFSWYLSQRILAVHPLANHLTVATQLQCRTVFACVIGSISGPWFPWRFWARLFLLSFSFYFPWESSQIPTIECKCHKIGLVNWWSFRSSFLLIQPSSPAQSVANSTWTCPRMYGVYLCFHLVWFCRSSLILLVRAPLRTSPPAQGNDDCVAPLISTLATCFQQLFTKKR